MATPRCKSPRIEEEWRKLPPKLTGLICFMDDWLFSQGMERLTVSDAYRSDDDSEIIYFQHYLSKGNSPAKARQLARTRPSLHKEWRAVDFRHTVKRYTKAEMDRIWAKLEELCNPREQWQLDLHQVFGGIHFHVGFKGVIEQPKRGAV